MTGCRHHVFKADVLVADTASVLAAQQMSRLQTSTRLWRTVIRLATLSEAGVFLLILSKIDIFLGNARQNNLYEIWNGDLYKKFRQDHFDLNPCIKCTKECDMPKIGDIV